MLSSPLGLLSLGENCRGYPEMNNFTDGKMVAEEYKIYIMFDIILNYYVRNATPLLLNRFFILYLYCLLALYLLFISYFMNYLQGRIPI